MVKGSEIVCCADKINFQSPPVPTRLEGDSTGHCPAFTAMPEWLPQGQAGQIQTFPPPKRSHPRL